MVAFAGTVAALIAAPGREPGISSQQVVERRPEPPPPDECEVLEKKLADMNCRLAPLDVPDDYAADGIAVVRYSFAGDAGTGPAPAPANAAESAQAEPSAAANTLRGFYLRHPVQRRAKLFQTPEGSETPGVLSLYQKAIVFDSPDHAPADEASASRASFGGDALTVLSDDGWEAFEVVPPGGAPAARREVVYTFEMVDGFMRAQFGRDDGWKTVSGTWALTQHGGGLPAGEDAAASAKVQRAVNPFSVTGYAPAGQMGTLAYTAPAARGDSYLAETRFHLGTPGAMATDRSYVHQPIPTFLIAQGEPAGDQAAFGWFAAGPHTPAAWSLCVRSGNDNWTVLKTWNSRPPRTNWVRAGIAVENGHTAFAMLDGRALGKCELGRMVNGPFQIHTGLEGRKIEFDDVAARPMAESDVTGPLLNARMYGFQTSYGNPVYRASRNFAEKELFDRTHDPVQYDYWARAANAWLISSRNDPSLGISGTCAVSRLPLMGDFTYRSTPALPPGDYRFLILRLPDLEQPAAPGGIDNKVADFTFTKTPNGWQQADNAFTLEFGRRGGELRLHTPDGPRPIPGIGDLPQALHLMVMPPGDFKPEDHLLYSQGTWHHMFEEAPSDYYWRDGMFGMNYRWSCQPGWNFMSGRSPALAAAFSKDAYYGDQVIESFMSLSMTLPAEQNYYIRQDLCVSWCTNGRDLDSGYTLIFGGERNSKTMLLRRGEVLATTDAEHFLIPKQQDHHHVHWLWWNFIFRKTGKLITITYNDQTLFEAEDPEPLDGGQVAFWTVANGIVVSRMTVVAQERREQPENALVEWHDAPAGWQPLHPDAVVIRTDKGASTVENPFGGDTFAARVATQADLSATPILELPLRLDPAARINLHVEIDRQPWIVQITAPVTDMEYMLVPSADSAYPFGRHVIEGAALDRIVLGKAEPADGMLRIDLGRMLSAKGVAIAGMKQISLTLGNSSNTGYLLAGFGGNQSGTTYTAGQPRWIPAP